MPSAGYHSSDIREVQILTSTTITINQSDEFNLQDSNQMLIKPL